MTRISSPRGTAEQGIGGGICSRACMTGLGRCAAPSIPPRRRFWKSTHCVLPPCRVGTVMDQSCVARQLHSHPPPTLHSSPTTVLLSPLHVSRRDHGSHWCRGKSKEPVQGGKGSPRSAAPGSRCTGPRPEHHLGARSTHMPSPPEGPSQNFGSLISALHAEKDPRYRIENSLSVPFPTINPSEWGF